MKSRLAPSVTCTSENVVLPVQDKRLEKCEVKKDHKDTFITVNYKNTRSPNIKTKLGQCDYRTWNES
jgi:hypothetical protein